MDLTLYTTTESGTQMHAFPFTTEGNDVEKEIVNLYPQMRYQTIEGFGGAITDSAGAVYAQMNREQQAALMRACFGPDDLRYRLIRVPMDSCDFSVEMYEAMSDPTDRALESFSFAGTEKYILPMLEDARRASSMELELMLSPWSPPAFMKTNGARKNGGKLKPEYRDFWADYLCRYIKEFRDRGFRIQRISVQNEPKATQTWDSCVFTPEEERQFLRDHLYPSMKRNGMDDIELFICDHNKERAFDRMIEVMDDSVQTLVAGVAFHWYSGDHFEALQLIHDAAPDLKLISSESCIERCFFGKERQLDNAMRMAHEIIGDLNHGMTAFYDWNLLLDEAGGPNHVGNYCDAAFLFDRKKQELISLPYRDVYWHFSHFIHQGARRIGMTRYTEKLDVTAAENPDGTIAAVLLNREEDSRRVILRMRDQIAELVLPPESMTTAVIR